jgi:hypothetical protein
LGLADLLAANQTSSQYTKTDVIELSRKLATHDAALLDRIPVFLRELKSNRYYAGDGILQMIRDESSSGAISLYLKHFEYLLDSRKVRSSIDRFVSGTLVAQYGLDEWRLPVERERKIIDLILRLRDDKRPTGDWLVPYILTNPDKADRVIDVLMKRDVNSAQAMEVLLDDEVPMAMQEGAL